MRFSLIALLTLTLIFVTARPADAYLDANTGSLLLQLLLGGVAGIALVGKLFWHRIKQFLGFAKSEHVPDQD